MKRIQPLAVTCALALSAAALSAFAQQAPGWRVYRAGDGLPQTACRSVTVGGAGDLFVEPLEGRSFARFDGYTWTNYAPSASRTILPDGVCESPAGQLWAASPGGLLEWAGSGWSLHPVNVISIFLARGPVKALCPIRQNVVLFLQAGALMEFSADAADPTVARTILEASETGLGHFTGMHVAADDGLWISGDHGLVKIAGPKRAIDESSTRREFLCPANLGVKTLGRPECADDDSVVCVATSVSGESRMVLQFDGQSWSRRSAGAKHIDYAWKGPDGGLWAAALDGVLRFDTARGVFEEEAIPGVIYDVAVGAHGMFWVASSEGLYCRVPEIWTPVSRAPDVFREHTLKLAAMNGDIWEENADDGILWRHDKQVTRFAPADAASPGAPVALAEMPDGKIWCATADKIWAFDGRNWTPVRAGLARVKTMFRASNGEVWVATAEGMHRYNRGNWIDMGIEEGLSSSDVRNVGEDASGRIWAETARGADVYRPEVDADPPHAFLNLPSARERNIPQGSSITLTFGGRDKWNITPPERLLFSWRLDDGDWSPFDASVSAPFGDLAAGKHYFQARAMDRNGNIDPQPARMEFAVILPWYDENRSRWIAGLGAVVALFFAGLAFKRHRELVLSHALVEKQVAERTAELRLANEELLQSQKMKALGTLAAGIAHDFNNILSIIKGSAQIIEQNVGDGQKIRARTDRIKTVVDQGSAVVQALLGFSRTSDEAIEECDINLVIENTIRLLGDRFLRETAVGFDPAVKLPAVRASKGLIQQILLNLIFNAAEAMSGRKEVVIDAAFSAKAPVGAALSPSAAAGYVRISVRDTGCGIPAEILPRIFEPFFTTKAMSSRRGTGLGLSVVYELAQKMGAGLAVESTPGRGSVFTLILEAAMAVEPVAVPVEASVP